MSKLFRALGVLGSSAAVVATGAAAAQAKPLQITGKQTTTRRARRPPKCCRAMA
jgi:hypothetical protein